MVDDKLRIGDKSRLDDESRLDGELRFDDELRVDEELGDDDEFAVDDKSGMTQLHLVMMWIIPTALSGRDSARCINNEGGPRYH